MMKWLLAILLAIVCMPTAVEPKPFIRPIAAAECLAWVIHNEARGEPLRGARAVLDTVNARMKKRKKSACEIVAERRQFSGYRKHSFYLVTDDMLQRYYRAAKMKPVMKGCDYFHAIYVTPKWANSMVRCGQVGRHVFYKERKKWN